jgi:hypothetical protein
MVHLGKSGKDINKDIGELVRKGRIGARTQKMLDSVRIVGNEAVHPGEINLNDDRELANALFYFINLIVFDAISYDKAVDSIYQKMPAVKRKGIEDRDRTKSLTID